MLVVSSRTIPDAHTAPLQLPSSNPHAPTRSRNRPRTISGLPSRVWLSFFLFILGDDSKPSQVPLPHEGAKTRSLRLRLSPATGWLHLGRLHGLQGRLQRPGGCGGEADPEESVFHLGYQYQLERMGFSVGQHHVCSSGFAVLEYLGSGRLPKV